MPERFRGGVRLGALRGSQLSEARPGLAVGGWILDPLIALLYHVLEGCGSGDVSFIQSIVDVFCAPSAVGLGGEVSDPRLSSLCHGEESELTGRDVRRR